MEHHFSRVITAKPLRHRSPGLRQCEPQRTLTLPWVPGWPKYGRAKTVVFRRPVAEAEIVRYARHGRELMG